MWDRHDHTIYPKVTEWFSIISEELARPDVLAENVYNMDETGVLLGKLGSLKVLVGKHELDDYMGASPKRTLKTAVECISAASNCARFRIAIRCTLSPYLLGLPTHNTR
jgi:hypothetical protein